MSAASQLAALRSAAQAVSDAMDLYVAHRLMPELGMADAKDPEFRRQDVRNWCGVVDAVKVLEKAARS